MEGDILVSLAIGFDLGIPGLIITGGETEKPKLMRDWELYAIGMVLMFGGVTGGLAYFLMTDYSF